jgi:hypothetical protein
MKRRVWIKPDGDLFLFIDFKNGTYLIQETEENGSLFAKESWRDVVLMQFFWQSDGYEELGEL